MGTVLQAPGVGCGGKILRNVNPCGTVLNCDPLEYDLLYQDHLPNYALDPTCTIPGFCGGTPFPPTRTGVGVGDVGTGSGAIVNTGGVTLPAGTTTGTGNGT